MLASRGIKLYRRCDFCSLKTIHCLGIQNNIIAIAIVIISLLFLWLQDPLYIRITIVTIGCLLVVLGFKINTNLDSLAKSERENNQLNIQLVEHSNSLESQVKERTQELEKMAIFDGLTGLVNRQEFEKRLKKTLEHTKQSEQHHALCFLDLDRFKIVNDTCGHIAGDELLRQLTPLLTEHIRETDTAARFGGDEFGILLMNCSIEKAQETAERIRRSIEAFQFVWHGTVSRIGVSIGIIGINKNSFDIIDVLAAVDDACYKAKELGRNRIQIYEDDIDDMERRHGEAKWVMRLQQALDKDEFVLYYQPIVSLKGKEDKLYFEVLLRMVDEMGNIIPPTSFISAAERFNFMSKIDRWVIRNAFKSYSVLEKQFPVTLSINISGASFADDDFADYIKEELHISDVRPENIIFEITETAAISSLGKASRLIDSLKEIGCKFALDDFGSGLSSFGYLKNLPVDYLKIDGSFVQDMINDRSDFDMVKAMNQISHTMGKKTIAEYVESEQIRSALEKIGVDYAQGFGLGKPVPLEYIMQPST
ncbi:MAG: hypothetical protein BMS9Abin19_0543 [Gammaproteobacteria bacterium]|nr:MAG: hypothetical protein BMS9Abin19_0543 [Gammaproteobacteria bacterium]